MPDWGELLDKGVEQLGRGVDSAKQAVGHGIDVATEVVGADLDRLGAHDWADKVEGFGDEVASGLGVSIREKQLGQSELADELVHGKAAAIRESAAHLMDFRTAFGRVGQGMKALNSDQWKGAAADAFREKFSMHPTDWFHAADACEAAGSALNRYAETVEWAQEQARGAIELHRAAVKARKDAADTYADQAEAFNAAVRSGAGDPGPPPVESTVGTAELSRAQEILTEARRQRDDAATTAERAIAAATDSPRPSRRRGNG
ncbi:putative T7SS-secreted protein [Streptomyces sp. DSM 116496]|uniref:putative T7SS-secreted protein n=1 Tax=Streptomyces stoeckheimensis TaxID=3344656 RepID=UPI0038B33E19